MWPTSRNTGPTSTLWRKKIPYRSCNRPLCDRGILTQSDVDDIQADADQQVEAAVAAMRARPRCSHRKSPCKMYMHNP